MRRGKYVGSFIRFLKDATDGKWFSYCSALQKVQNFLDIFQFSCFEQKFTRKLPKILCNAWICFRSFRERSFSYVEFELSFYRNYKFAKRLTFLFWRPGFFITFAYLHKVAKVCILNFIFTDTYSSNCTKTIRYENLVQHKHPSGRKFQLLRHQTTAARVSNLNCPSLVRIY